MSEHVAEPQLLRDAEGKIGAIVQHCLYVIATGKWPAGARLPSIRAAEEMWGVNHLTVQKAYRRLEEMGLAQSRPKSGYFVVGPDALDRIAAHRHELDRFHQRVGDLARKELGLSTLGVLRYLTQLEEIRSREAPECAFVECTVYQAGCHATEISNRFSIPVVALTTASLSGRRARVPRHVRMILTTHFHLKEVRTLANPPKVTVTAVPIELAPSMLDMLRSKRGRVLLLETEQGMALHIAADAERLIKGTRVRTMITRDVQADLDRLVSSGTRSSPTKTVFLSPRVWGNLDARWQECPSVRPVEFRICESAWTLVADAIGLPLGSYSL